MESTRRCLRVQCKSRCILAVGNTNCKCILEDLSICGALVKVSDERCEVYPGVNCELFLCPDPEKCPGKCTCQVKRLSTKGIGLEFVNAPIYVEQK